MLFSDFLKEFREKKESKTIEKTIRVILTFIFMQILNSNIFGSFDIK